MVHLNQIRRQNKRSAANIEAKITGRLRSVTGGAPDYWDFRDGAEDLASKRLFQYPAMMVPAMQKQVIAAILTARPEIQTIADPFLGSGTILALAMLSGRAFVGQDINPLAILIAKTRAFSLNHLILTQAVGRVNALIKRDQSICYDIKFKRQAKWFKRGANIGLSRIRRAIMTEKDISVRRFLWVCLAETVRLNSNSRTSTYKLHIKPKAKRIATTASVLASFTTISSTNLLVISDFRDALYKAGHLDKDGKYKQHVHISYGDTTKNFPTAAWAEDGKYQAVVTSPPYGDNKTTVPYGQAAWLPLQWIDLADIDSGIPKNAAEGYYDIDNCSLGGQRPRDFSYRQKDLAKIGDHTKRYIEKLASISREGLSRFVNFTYDLRDAISNFTRNCNDYGYIVLTLGNRNIRGTVCPLSDICAEMLGSHNIKMIFHITRQIPSKRMPGKNAHSATINQEFITVYRKLQPTLTAPIR